jgi:hypothetical protein
MMKKKLALALLMATLFVGGAFAQEWYNSYAPGIDGSMFLINAGIGWVYYDYDLLKLAIPPISASVEYAKLPIPIPLSVGGYFTISRTKDRYGKKGDDYSYTNIAFGGRAAYHFNFLENLDVYGGVNTGYIMINKKYDISGVEKKDPITGVFFLSPFVGARYYFLNFLGGFAEFGYGFHAPTVLSTGLTFKF